MGDCGTLVAHGLGSISSATCIAISSSLLASARSLSLAARIFCTTRVCTCENNEGVSALRTSIARLTLPTSSVNCSYLGVSIPTTSAFHLAALLGFRSTFSGPASADATTAAPLAISRAASASFCLRRSAFPGTRGSLAAAARVSGLFFSGLLKSPESLIRKEGFLGFIRAPGGVLGDRFPERIPILELPEGEERFGEGLFTTPGIGAALPGLSGGGESE